jgi:hypothetical protein
MPLTSGCYLGFSPNVIDSPEHGVGTDVTVTKTPAAGPFNRGSFGSGF